MEVAIKPGDILLRAIASRALEYPKVMLRGSVRSAQPLKTTRCMSPGFPQVIPGNFNLASDYSGQY
jgi:hypothetical protein